ncbi:MAG: NUDIX domain-containing protein [Oscillospiraceae bacterium]
MKYEKSCGAIVFRKKDNNIQVLVIRHKNSENWTFPKGHTEKGETEFQTALREVKEETGLNIVIKSGFREKLKYFPKANVLKEVVYFIAEIDEEKDFNTINLTDDIVDEAKWINAFDTEEVLNFDNHKSIFKKAYEYYISF